MALKFEKVYQASKLDLNLFLEVSLILRKKILEELKKDEDIKQPIIRLNWGAEYVDFSISDPRREYLFPQEGTTKGFQMTGVKEYKLREFHKLMSNCTRIQLFEKDLNLELGKYFDKAKIFHYKDYPRMITDLEEEKCVETIKSQNIMTVDGRRFKVTKKGESLVPGLERHCFFEVDSLGTSMFIEMSKNIENLWLKFY
jgi:hypothetical protein